jgi:hypothetical protein
MTGADELMDRAEGVEDMLVDVISAVDESKGVVDASLLEILIKNGTIRAFKRKRRWVVIDQHDVRRESGDYTGPERRKIAQVPE